MSKVPRVAKEAEVKVNVKVKVKVKVPWRDIEVEARRVPGARPDPEVSG